MAFLETSIYQRQVEFSLKNVNQDHLFIADRQSTLLSIEQEYLVTRFGCWAGVSGCSLVVERKQHNQDVMGSNPAGCGAFSVLFLIYLAVVCPATRLIFPSRCFVVFAWDNSS